LNSHLIFSRVPGIHIVTDVICGFPTEQLEDFQQTYDLVNKYKFQSLFINQFFPRPGTPAAKMRHIATNERKRRTKIISELFHSYSNHDQKIGEKFKVLVTEISHDSLHYDQV
jgi:threonylcarbamoyladenosine tRNA methylthiotransferase CDKAL1